jgi:hypothetical protein
MLNLRNTAPAVDGAREAAKERATKVVNSAAQSAKDISSQVEQWAKDGYGSAREAMKTEPFKWGALSLGFGALVGGLFTLWRRNTKTEQRPARNTMAVRARSKQSLRGAADVDAPEVAPVRKKAKRTRRARQSANV